MPTTGATIQERDPKVTFTTTTFTKALVHQPSALSSRRSPRVELIQPTKDVHSQGDRAGTVNTSLGPPTENIRRCYGLQRLLNLIRRFSDETTLSKPWEFRECTGVNHCQFARVLLRAVTVNHPFASIKAGDGHTGCVECQEPVNLMGAGSRCGEPITACGIAR